MNMDFLGERHSKPSFDPDIWRSISPRGTETTEELEEARGYMEATTQDRMSLVEMEYTDSSIESNRETGVTLERSQGRRSLAGVIYAPPAGSPPGHYRHPQPAEPPEPRITRSVASDFKKKSTNSVLEVLLEEPSVRIGSRLRKSSLAGNNAPDAHTRGPVVIRQNPKRIRIRSAKLLRALSSVADTAGHTFITSGTSSIVFLHPFKQFVSLEPFVRERVSDLELKHRKSLTNGVDCEDEVKTPVTNRITRTIVWAPEPEHDEARGEVSRETR